MRDWRGSWVLTAGLSAFLFRALEIFAGLKPAECASNIGANHDTCRDFGILVLPLRPFIWFGDHHEGFVVGAATVALAIFTFQLWRSTNKLWTETRDAGETNKAVAEASRLSAEATLRQTNLMAASERGRLLPGTPNMTKIFPPRAPVWYDEVIAKHVPTIEIHFFNVGRGTAWVEEVRAELCLGNAPSTPEYSHGRTISGEQPVIASDKTTVFSFPFRGPISRPQIEAIQKGELNVWFFGHIRYWDTFSTTHELHFAFHILRGSGSEQPWNPAIWGGKAFNYERQIEANYTNS
jgi:hypothetical protein